jgi:mono/diheme cytochrome c family protein
VTSGTKAATGGGAASSGSDAADILKKGDVKMKRSIKRMKLTVITTASALALTLAFAMQPATRAAVAADDAAATFMAKCKMCHGAAAEKNFDAKKADADLVKAILEGTTSTEGKKMPAFKAINEETAKALVAHMKSLKQ